MSQFAPNGKRIFITKSKRWFGNFGLLINKIGVKAYLVHDRQHLNVA